MAKWLSSAIFLISSISRGLVQPNGPFSWGSDLSDLFEIRDSLSTKDKISGRSRFFDAIRSHLRWIGMRFCFVIFQMPVRKREIFASESTTVIIFPRNGSLRFLTPSDTHCESHFQFSLISLVVRLPSSLWFCVLSVSVLASGIFASAIFPKWTCHSMQVSKSNCERMQKKCSRTKKE